jgi:hypothetical protein
MYRSSFFRFVIAISASIFAAQGFAQQLTVQFRSGTSLTGHVEQPSIDWTTVSANGAVSQFNYKLSQIKTLSLSPTESSEQMIQIRQLLNQLGDDDYHQRELAEARLKSIGGQFRGTVESFADHPSYEVRYRVKRLLSEKSFRPTSSTRREVDRVTLVDGAQWEGEATNFALTLTAYGETIQLDRQKVAGLTSAAGTRLDARALAARDSPAKVELFHRYEDFVAEGQKEFRFDTQGGEFALPCLVSQIFVSACHSGSFHR